MVAFPLIFAPCVTDFSRSVRFHAIRLMHEVVPSVVAIAVRMVMAMCSTFSQKDLFAMMFVVL